MLFNNDARYAIDKIVISPMQVKIISPAILPCAINENIDLLAKAGSVEIFVSDLYLAHVLANDNSHIHFLNYKNMVGITSLHNGFMHIDIENFTYVWSPKNSLLEIAYHSSWYTDLGLLLSRKELYINQQYFQSGRLSSIINVGEMLLSQSDSTKALLCRSEGHDVNWRDEGF